MSLQSDFIIFPNSTAKTVLASILLYVVCFAETTPNEQFSLNLNQLQKANLAFSSGHFIESVNLFRTAVDDAIINYNQNAEIDALIGLGSAYSALGQQRLAIDSFKNALTLFTTNAETSEVTTHIRIKASLANALLASGELNESESFIKEALLPAKKAGDKTTEAALLFNYGNLLAARYYRPVRIEYAGIHRGENSSALPYTLSPHILEASREYKKCLEIARELNDEELIARVQISLARANLLVKQYKEAESLTLSGWQMTEKLPDTFTKATLQLSCGETFFELAALSDKKKLLKSADKAAQQARNYLKKSKNERMLAYAYGLSAKIAEKRKKFDNAMEWAQKATFLSQKMQDVHGLFRWHWQIARLLQKQGQQNQAVMLYEQTQKELRLIRSEISKGFNSRSGGNSFREVIGPFYYEYVDILFQQAEEVNDPEQNQEILGQARNVIESFKQYEIDDYFIGSDCFSLIEKSKVRIDTILPGLKKTAVIYIIPLPERMEIIISLSSGLTHKFENISGKELMDAANQLRADLQNKNNNDAYLTTAQKLYQHIIKPIELILQENDIDTLVIIPDGPLQSIPFSVLHDGRQFLVEKYALAVSPGLTLIAPTVLKKESAQIIAGGISEGINNFSPLNNVPIELDAILAEFSGKKLINDTFTSEGFADQMKTDLYSIVHIATHGKLGINAAESYLLAHDGAIYFTELGELMQPFLLREESIDLITLSACQTAIGDDRSALGLAGLCIKSGVRSALASLWQIDDASTSQLMATFYSKLKNRENSKAEAIRQAQLHLINNTAYKHPYYWAPFIIIGSWL